MNKKKPDQELWKPRDKFPEYLSSVSQKWVDHNAQSTAFTSRAARNITRTQVLVYSRLSINIFYPMSFSNAVSAFVKWAHVISLKVYLKGLLEEQRKSYLPAKCYCDDLEGKWGHWCEKLPTNPSSSPTKSLGSVKLMALYSIDDFAHNSTNPSRL